MEPIFKTYDQQLLESIVTNIASFHVFYIQSERHRMGLMSDNEYKQLLEEIRQGLVDIFGSEDKEKKHELQN